MKLLFSLALFGLLSAFRCLLTSVYVVPNVVVLFPTDSTL